MPNVHIRIFRKRSKLTLGGFSLWVSLRYLKSLVTDINVNIVIILGEGNLISWSRSTQTFDKSK